MGTEIVIMLIADAVVIAGGVGYVLMELGKYKHKLLDAIRRVEKLEESDTKRTEGREEILERLTRMETKMDFIINGGDK